MVLAVKLADVGLGALAGAVISSTVLLILDHRHRSWERENRWHDDKRRGYARYLESVDTLFEGVQFAVMVTPALNRLQADLDADTEPNSADLQLMRQSSIWHERIMPRLYEHLLSATTELSLIAPESVAQAGGRLVDPMVQLRDSVEGDGEGAADAVAEYKRARQAFLAEARRDLGVGI